MSFSGIFPGIVVNDKDPIKKGRLQVRTAHFGADGMDDMVADKSLPWAYPCLPCIGKSSGIISVPEVGAGVWVMFANEDVSSPVWLGGWIGNADHVAEHQYDEMPVSFVFKTPGDNKLVLSDKRGQEHILVKDFSGQEILLKPSEYKTDILLGDFFLRAKTMKMISLGSLALTVTAMGTLSFLASLSLTVAATFAATAAVINLFALNVVIGQSATAQYLCNTFFLALFNAHTHTYSPGPGSPVPTTTPEIPAVIGVHTTINTRVS